MRTLILIVGILMGGSALADTVVRCRQASPGIYPNTVKVNVLDFVSYVDHFSLANLRAMKLESELGSTIYLREWMKAERQTQMGFLTKKQGKNLQSWVHIDRTPRQVIESRSFVGVLFIAQPSTEKVDQQPMDLSGMNINTFNFECSF